MNESDVRNICKSIIGVKMNGEQQKDDKFVPIATKVPSHVSELLSMLAKMRGMEVYELLQLLVHGFISYAKNEADVPSEFRRLYEGLKFDVAFNKAYNFASPTAQQDIAQMILILQQPGREGFGMTMIDKPYMDEARMTTCMPEIVERVLQLALGTNDYIDLRNMARYHGASSSLDMISKMILAQGIIDIEDSNRDELPCHGQYHDFGKIIEYGKRTRQTKTFTPDNMPRQQTIQWDDDDKAIADYEAKDWEGEHRNPENDEPPVRPFDVEW